MSSTAVLFSMRKRKTENVFHVRNIKQKKEMFMFPRFNEFCLSLVVFMALNLTAVQKPNFVLILADDLGYGDVGFTGSSQISTPHIDALAKDGVIFTQGYVSSAVCGPSRAGLMTGKNQVRFGFDNNLTTYLPQFKDEFHGLPLSEKTLATRLAEQGYTNGLIGKWHLGDKEKYLTKNAVSMSFGVTWEEVITTSGLY